MHLVARPSKCGFHPTRTISYEDSIVAVGGSANMTKAAWSRNDEFIFHVEGQANECLSRPRTVHRILNTQNTQDTQDLDACHDTADTMAIDDENTADITQALVQPSWWNDWAHPKTRRHLSRRLPSQHLHSLAIPPVFSIIRCQKPMCRHEDFTV
ncbi:hypothetical protein GQ600_13483 [Phytophthora cactorum]|nr:hypothetical protein GQ600_13483 [Phytophthora cactorum]